MRVYWREGKNRYILVLAASDQREVEVGGVRRTPRGYDAFAITEGYDPGRARQGLLTLGEAKAFVESFRPWEMNPEGLGLEVEQEALPSPEVISSPMPSESEEPAAKKKRWWEFGKKG